MEIAALAVKQAIAQTGVAMSMVRQSAQTEQAIVDMVASSVNRGQNLDVSV